MKNREFVMLASDWRGTSMTGWEASEKLDGMRALWDGGVYRGKEAFWAAGRVGTGLWSRYGKPIHAPDWWLDQLPPFTLDGELWLGRNMFQETVSVTRSHNADWQHVKFKVFGSPGMALVTPGLISGRFLTQYFPRTWEGPLFASGEAYENLIVKPVEQHMWATEQPYWDLYAEVLDRGGEGIMLRAGSWEPYRSRGLQKLKPIDTGTGTVMGFTAGLGKLEGLIGAVLVKYKDVWFELSGFNDAERVWAGEDGAVIKRGQLINFKFNGVTQDGKPRNARYSRSRTQV